MASLISAGRVLAGPGLDVVDNATIVVRDGSIVNLSETEAGDLGDAIDARDLTVLPGFIDAHVHIGFHEPIEVLEGGVTTVRDLGWPPEPIFELAAASRSAGFPGPEVLAVGPIHTPPGGYPSRAAWAPAGTARAVADPRDAETAVKDAHSSGATAIKIALNPPVGPTFSPTLLGALVDEAHALDLRVTAHVHGLEELRKALDAGVDELAHMLLSEEAVPDEFLDEMVESATTIVPTLSIRFGADRHLAIENLARFWSRGGCVVYGTDLGNEGPRPGIDPAEIDGMAQAGMEPRAIVAAGTVIAAGYLGLSDRGRIQEGYRADLIGVDGDPLQDPEALTRVRFVMRGGRVVRNGR